MAVDVQLTTSLVGFQQVQQQLQQLGVSISKVGSDVAATAKSWTDFGSRMQGLGVGLSALSVPVALFGKSMISAAGDFEASMNKMQALSGATAEQMERISATAQEVGANTVFSASEAADALINLAKNNVTVEDSLGGVLDATVALAAATKSDLGFAADVAAKAMAQFGANADQLPGMMEQLFNATKSSTFELNDMAYALGQAGGVAGKVGVDFAEFNTAITMTSSSFFSGADAGTSFKVFLTNLTPATKSAREAMHDLGLKFTDAKGAFLPMREIVGQLHDSFAGLTDAQKVEAAQTIFGTDAMRTALALAEGGVATWDKYAGQIAQTGTMQESATALMKGFNGAMEQVSGAFENLGIAIGRSGLLEWLTSAAIGFADFIDWIAKLPAPVLAVGTVIAGLVAAAGPLVLILGTMATGIGALGMAFGGLVSLGAGVTTLLGGIAGAFGLLLSPIGLAVAAVAGIGVALYTFSDTFRGWVDGIAGYAADLYRSWDGTLGGLVEVVDRVGADVTAGCARLFEGAKAWLSDAWDSLASSGLGVYLAGLVSDVSTYAGDLATAARALFDDAAAWLLDAWDSLDAAASGLGSYLGDLVDTVAEIGGDIADAAQALYEGAIEWLVDKWEMLVGTSSGLAVYLEDFVQSILDTAADAIKAAQDLYNGVTTWLVDKLKAALSAVNPFAPISEGAKETYDEVVGHSIIPDMVKEIIAELGRMQTEATAKAAKTKDGMVGEFGKLSGALEKEVGKAIQVISGSDWTLAEKIRGFDELKAAVEKAGTAGLEAMDKLRDATSKVITEETKRQVETFLDGLGSSALDQIPSIRNLSDEITGFGKDGEAAMQSLQRGIESVSMEDLRNILGDTTLTLVEQRNEIERNLIPAFDAMGKAGETSGKMARESLEELNRTLQDNSSYWHGAQEAFADYYNDVTNRSGTMKGIVTDAFQGMEDGLEQFFLTGKVNLENIPGWFHKAFAELAAKEVMALVTGSGKGLLDWLANGVPAASNTAQAGLVSSFAAMRTTVASDSSAMGLSFSGSMNTASTTIGGILNTLKTTISGWVAGLVPFWNSLTTAFSGAFSGAIAGIQGTLSSIASAISSWISGTVVPAFSGMTTNIGSIFSGLSGSFGSTLASIGSAVTSWAPGILSTFTNMTSGIGSAFGNLSSWGSNVLEVIGSGARSAAGAVASFVGNLLSFHEGGQVPGIDSSEYLSVLEHGEFVVNKESTAKYRGLIEAINSNNLRGVSEWFDALPGREGGRTAFDIVGQLFSAITPMGFLPTNPADFGPMNQMAGSLSSLMSRVAASAAGDMWEQAAPISQYQALDNLISNLEGRYGQAAAEVVEDLKAERGKIEAFGYVGNFLGSAVQAILGTFGGPPGFLIGGAFKALSGMAYDWFRDMLESAGLVAKYPEEKLPALLAQAHSLGEYIPGQTWEGKIQDIALMGYKTGANQVFGGSPNDRETAMYMSVLNSADTVMDFQRTAAGNLGLDGLKGVTFNVGLDSVNWFKDSGIMDTMIAQMVMDPFNPSNNFGFLSSAAGFFGGIARWAGTQFQSFAQWLGAGRPEYANGSFRWVGGFGQYLDTSGNNAPGEYWSHHGGGRDPLDDGGYKGTDYSHTVKHSGGLIDTVQTEPLVKLLRGEYVINPESTAAYLPLLEAINSGELDDVMSSFAGVFHDGGFVRGLEDDLWGVVQSGEYIINPYLTSRYDDLLMAVNDNDPSAVAEILSKTFGLGSKPMVPTGKAGLRPFFDLIRRTMTMGSDFYRQISRQATTMGQDAIKSVAAMFRKGRDPEGGRLDYADVVHSLFRSMGPISDTIARSMGGQGAKLFAKLMAGSKDTGGLRDATQRLAYFSKAFYAGLGEQSMAGERTALLRIGAYFRDLLGQGAGGSEAANIVSLASARSELGDVLGEMEDVPGTLADRTIGAQVVDLAAFRQTFAGLDDQMRGFLLKLGDFNVSNDNAQEFHNTRISVTKVNAALTQAAKKFAALSSSRVEAGDMALRGMFADAARYYASPPDTRHFGTGGDMIASGPTMIEVGEQGPEHVQVTPLNRGRGAGGQTNIVFQGPVIADGMTMAGFTRRLMRETEKQQRRLRGSR